MTADQHTTVFTDWVATARLGDPEANGSADAAVRSALRDEAVMAALTAVYLEDRTTLRAVLDDLRAAGVTVKRLDALLADIKDRAKGEVGDDDGKDSQATVIVNVALGADAELFHDAEGLTYATIPVGEHRETYRTVARPFKLWLRRLFREATGKSCQSQAVTDAVNELEGIGLFDGEEIEVHVRLAEHGDAIYFDLGLPDWSAVEIDADGWRIVADSPVRFRRPKALLALPAPAAGGDISELWDFLNVEEEDRPLVLGWLIVALRPRGPYFVLNLLGEQGSAKSTAAKVLRRLVDPNTADLRGAVKEPRDLMIAAIHGVVIALDNVSHLPDWLSDGLCRLSTGGGFSTRTLYTDEEETIFEAQRPIILNGIAELATRADLLDRSLLVTLPVIEEEDRKAEEEFWEAFADAHPRLLGALFSAVSVALRERQAIQVDRLPRMADATMWVMAAESALGLDDGAFIKAYDLSRDEGTIVALEAAPIGPPLLVFLAGRDGWAGTASDLLDRLNTVAGNRVSTNKYWPRSPRSLSSALRRLAPPLRSIDWEVAFTRRPGGNRDRLVTFTRTPEPGGDDRDGDDYSQNIGGNGGGEGTDAGTENPQGRDTTVPDRPTVPNDGPDRPDETAGQSQFRDDGTEWDANFRTSQGDDPPDFSNLDEDLW